jgi:basic membrane lipoprotein Med (substrate-binding protein (PBP1-ABC) superfamily)
VAPVQARSPADFADAFRDFGSWGFDLVFAHGFEYTDAAMDCASEAERALASGRLSISPVGRAVESR